MKRKKRIIFQLLALTALIFMIEGCSDSNSNLNSVTVETRTLGVHTKEAPAVLTQSAYRIPASQSTYAAFNVAESSTTGYMISEGTVEIYDINGSLLYSDIFFPVGNSYKAISLDAGQYLIKIQNSINEDSSFTIFSEAMVLDCTTIRSSESIRIAGKVNEFIAIEVPGNQVGFQAALPTGKLTLFDRSYTELTSSSSSINRSLSAGKYILLVDNTNSQTYETLEIVME